MRAAERDAKVAAAVAASEAESEALRLVKPSIQRAQSRARKAERRGFFRPLECYMRCGTGKPFKMLLVVTGPGKAPERMPCCPDCVQKIRAAHIAEAIKRQNAQADPIGRAVERTLSGVGSTR